jgi:hypothetical protein
VVEPGGWHDWWIATDRDVRVRVAATPGERWLHGLETLWGLARLSHTPRACRILQLAVFALEFSDVGGFRLPPPAIQGRSSGRSLPSPAGAGTAQLTHNSRARYLRRASEIMHFSQSGT